MSQRPVRVLGLLVSTMVMATSACGSKDRPAPTLGSTTGMVTALAADAGGVVWVAVDDKDVSQLWYAPAAGEGISLGTLPRGAFSLAIDGTSIYWAEADVVRRVPRDATDLSTAVDVGRVPDTVRAVAVQRDHVYMIDDEHLRRAPLAGGDVEDLWASPQGLHLSHLGLAGGVVIVGGSNDGENRTELWRVGPAGEAQRLADAAGLLSQLVVDDARVAWTSKQGSARGSYVVAVAGGEATNLQLAGTVLAVDGPQIYWRGDTDLQVRDAAGKSTRVADDATRMVRGGDHLYVVFRRADGSAIGSLPR